LVIYFKNRKSLGSGLITALTNRVGDAVFLVLLGVSLGLAGGLRHCQVVCLLLLTITKRAQYPFSSWLPAAMAAPTPVRALVHSRTLVTAGVYVLLRYNPHDSQWILVAGSVTMLMAGLCACAEMDLKKIVALRTLSQLGVMMVAIGLGRKELCFFHLITHAMFKALLFLCVGVCIHTTYGGQDLRSFNSLGTTARGASVMTGLARLALLGFPFLAGFFSKDLILESAYSRGVACQSLVWFLMGVGLTTAYSVKILMMVVPPAGGAAAPCTGSVGAGPAVKGPTAALAVGAALGGALLCAGGAPVVVGGLDKAIPLLFTSAGITLGVAARGLRLRYFSSMWNLTPGFQRTAAWAASGRAALQVEAGYGLGAGGGSLAGVAVARWPYTAASVGVLWAAAAAVA